MRPVIDTLELPQVAEVTTSDERALVEHKPPGMEGSVLQNLGRSATVISLSGSATGDGALDFVGKLDALFRRAEPVAFTADIVADGVIDKVRIDDCSFVEHAGKPSRFDYHLVLKEHIEPVAPADAHALDAGILADAQGLMEGLLGNLDKGPGFVAALQQFGSVLEEFVKRMQELNKTAQGS